MLKKSKQRHDRSIKVIEEDLEKKVWAATRNRQRQEEALKSYKLQQMKREKDSMKTYLRNLRELKHKQDEYKTNPAKKVQLTNRLEASLNTGRDINNTDEKKHDFRHQFFTINDRRLIL